MATSYFFTNTDGLSEENNLGFGPIDENSFRVTSSFTFTGELKAYAVTDGHLFVVPNSAYSDKVNVVLKPLNSLYMGVKIKYLIYRGIKKSNFIKTFNNEDLVTALGDPDATPLIAQLWDDFGEFNAANPNEQFKATYIGIDSSITSDEKIIKKFFNQTTYNLPKVKAGDVIGSFKNNLGFDVVIDFGDYVQSIEESGFSLDIDYLKAKECILNVNSSNPSDIAGNKPASVSDKIFRENVFMFLDPAAFYGAHISVESLQSKDIQRNSDVNKVIHFPDSNSNSDKIFYTSEIYLNIINKFITKNNLYLYVLGKRGRSVDFYNPPGPANVHSGVSNFLKTQHWPIRIITGSTSPGISRTNENFMWPRLEGPQPNTSKYPIPENTIYFNIQFDLTKNETFDSFFYLNDSFNKSYYIEERYATDVGDKTVINPKDHTDIIFKKPAYINNISGGITQIDNDPDRVMVANFVYAFYRETDLVDNFNNCEDIFGPIDLERIYEALDYENNDNLIETVVYKKLAMAKFNNSKYLTQNYIVYDQAAANRLYVAYTIDSPETEFIKSTQELIAKYSIDYDLNSIFNINDALTGDTLRFWKNQKMVNGTPIFYLSITGNGTDFNNLNRSYMLGITNDQYNSLLNINTDDKLNIYVEFKNLSYTDGVYSAEVGIKYENIDGEVIVAFPAVGSEIMVYSGNGLIFTSTGFSNSFSYASQIADTIVNFLPKDNWKGIPSDNFYGIGEYGVDWMRTEPLSSSNIYYPPFSEITGILIGQTDMNQFDLPFEFRPEIYSQLKREIYDAVLVPWGTLPNDEYFTTWLRLGPAEEAVLKLRIIVNAVPERLTITYEASNYEITVYNDGTEIGNRENKPNNIKDYILPGSLFTDSSIEDNFTIKIKRLQEASADEQNRRLEIFATENINGQRKENIAGMIKIFQEPEIQLNVIIANVTIKNFDGPGTTIVSRSMYDKQRDYLIRYLHQAGIKANIPIFDESPIIDVSTDPKFLLGGDYIVNSGDGILIAGKIEGTPPSGYVPIKDYLKSKLPDAVSNPIPVNGLPQTSLIIYFINRRAKTKDAITNQAVELDGRFLGGFSSGENSDAIMFTQNENDKITCAHEVLHSLGLGHTFSRWEKFSFDSRKTDNIMDYTQLATSLYTSQPATYYWQWLKARKIAQSWKRK
ncbi:hypothetical protein FUA48_14090 [Flavobacterium alkalisoli]|uniref:Uncharacterized protein n=1 Tax=Flavobacterium alkalisoli TaxID=2602769 RepID=A0A5B9G0Z3_9FLAO|nr:hypothetical protein [Flavobacterium alkalisoli]QEE50667.1 hypothetical protein FUA48_14090 [Flavobacterium alkalisoli]